MPKILIQTDDGVTVQTVDFPLDSGYALYRMPSCPSHVGINTLLHQLSRALEDACEVQQSGGTSERLSEQVMRRMHEQSYKVIRFHRDNSNPEHRKVIHTGLTLAQAQAHCLNAQTREEDATGVVWFDGYEAE